VPWQEWQQAADATLKDFGKTYNEVLQERNDIIGHDKRAREWIERLKNGSGKGQNKSTKAKKSRPQ
jgi:hypothetical protein